MNAEINLINHVLSTGDISSPLNTDAGKSITDYKDEWDFLVEYHTKYREVPPESVFLEKFPHFDRLETEAVMGHYIEELHKAHARRVIQKILTSGAAGLKQYGPFHTLNVMQSELAQLGRATKMVHDLDLVANSDERLENLEQRLAIIASGKSMVGIPSGFKAIDDAYGGWKPGDLIVIAGWSGQGKSALALKMAQNAWLEGYRVMYFSLEMSALQIGYRFDTYLAGSNGGGFTSQDLFNAENITYDKYKNWLGSSMDGKNPFIVVTNENLEEVTASTVSAKIDQHKPQLVLLDYHSLFDSDRGIIGETEKQKELSKAFKRLAMKTGVAIIDIAGVTQGDGHGDRPPELHELAWTKQLAYDSNLTMTLVRHGNTIELVSKKVRQGKEFRLFIDVDFDKGTFREHTSNSLFGNGDNDED